MKKPNKQLLDDLLEDDATPDFQAALMGKTLQSARRRKRARHFSVAVCALAVAGIFLFSFSKTRERAVPSEQYRPIEALAGNEELPQSIEVVTTKPDSVGEVVTSTRNYG